MQGTKPLASDPTEMAKMHFSFNSKFYCDIDGHKLLLEVDRNNNSLTHIGTKHFSVHPYVLVPKDLQKFTFSLNAVVLPKH